MVVVLSVVLAAVSALTYFATTAAAAASSSQAAPVVTISTISFLSNMQIATTGAFSETDKIIVAYDFARILPRCNANITSANTTVTAFYKVFGSVYANTLLDTQYQINSNNFSMNPFEAPGPLSFWFSCSKNGSAPVYDSDYSRNFNFNINGAVINFEADFTNPITGTLTPNQAILVRYSVDRVNNICPTNATDPTLTVIGNYQTNNGPVQTWTVYTAYLDQGRFISSYNDGVIYSNGGQLTLWFSCQSHQSTGWDSKYSRNYVFNV